MAKYTYCPKCNTSVRHGANPHTCKTKDGGGCGTRFNSTVQTGAMRLKGLADERVSTTLKAMHEIGQACLNFMKRRINTINMIRKKEGLCLECISRNWRKKKIGVFDACNYVIVKDKLLMAAEEDLQAATVKLQYQYGDGGVELCSACAIDSLFGEVARKDIVPLLQKQIWTPRLTHHQKVWKRSVVLAKRWFDDNWVALAQRGSDREFFAKCKEQARNLVPPREPSMVTHVRTTWAESPANICLVSYVDNFVRGQDILQENRTKRRRKMREINRTLPKVGGDAYKPKKERKKPKFHPTGGTLTNFVAAVALPVCGDCEFLEKHEWGWSCARARKKRLNNFPTFPSTILDLAAGEYTINNEAILKGEEDPEVTIAMWEKAVRETATIMGPGWLRDYGYTDIDSRRVFPFLWHRKVARGYQSYLMAPRTVVTEIREGPWEHRILVGMKETIVVSTDGEKRFIRYFDHTQVVEAKTFYQQQRADAGKRKVFVLEGEADGLTPYDLKTAMRQMVANGHQELGSCLPKREADGHPYVPRQLGKSGEDFATWYDPLPESLRLAIEQTAREIRQVSHLIGAMHSLIYEGVLSENRVPLNQKGGKFQGWYSRQSADLQEQLTDRAALLQERKRGEKVRRVRVAETRKKSRKKMREAQPNYFKIPRRKETHTVTSLFHDESRTIVEYLEGMPGMVTVIRPIQHLYGRSDDKRREHNQVLGRWVEGKPAQFLKYKAQNAGFVHKEDTYDLFNIVRCPECRSESEGRWQDRIVIDGVHEESCAVCDHRFKFLEAMVYDFLNPVAEVLEDLLEEPVSDFSELVATLSDTLN